MKVQKKLWIGLVAIMLICFGLGSSKSKAAQVVEEPLDFTSKAADETTEGYQWDATNHVLTLKGLCVDLNNYIENKTAILVPDDTTVICEKDTYNCVIGSERFAIASESETDTNATLTIKGPGKLDFQYCEGGIGSYNHVTIEGLELNSVGGNIFIYMQGDEMKEDHWLTIKESNLTVYNACSGIDTRGQYQKNTANISKPLYEINVLIEHSDVNIMTTVDYFNPKGNYHGIVIRNGRLILKDSTVKLDSIQAAVLVWRQYKNEDSTSSLIEIQDTAGNFVIPDGKQIQSKEKAILGCKFRVESIVNQGENFDFDFERSMLLDNDTNQTVEVPVLAYGCRLQNASDKFSIRPYSEATIHFNSNGGTAVADTTYSLLHKMGGFPVPWREGYEFLGWSKTISDETVVNYEDFLEGEEEITLYAVWKQNVLPSAVSQQDASTQSTTMAAQSTDTSARATTTTAQTNIESKWSKVSGFKQTNIKTNQITLVHNVMEGATGYKIYAYDTSAKKYVLQSTLKSENRSITYKKIKNAKGKKVSIQAGTKVKFQIKAIKKVNGKQTLSKASVVTAYTCPATMKCSVSRMDKGKKLLVKWKKNTSSSGYQIRIRIKGAKKDLKVVSLSGKKTAYAFKASKKKQYIITIQPYKTQGKRKIYGAKTKVVK